MVVADSRGSLGDACAADKSQRFESNGSSKQRDVEQMPVRLADAFVRKRAHTVPVNWRLADEPHGVSVPDPIVVNVCACPAAARVVDCMRDAVERGGKSGADNFPASPAPEVGSELTIAWATTAALARASSSLPYRSKTIDVTAGSRWSCLRWVCGVV